MAFLSCRSLVVGSRFSCDPGGWCDACGVRSQGRRRCRGGRAGGSAARGGRCLGCSAPWADLRCGVGPPPPGRGSPRFRRSRWCRDRAEASAPSQLWHAGSSAASAGHGRGRHRVRPRSRGARDGVAHRVAVGVAEQVAGGDEYGCPAHLVCVGLFGRVRALRHPIRSQESLRCASGRRRANGRRRASAGRRRRRPPGLPRVERPQWLRVRSGSRDHGSVSCRHGSGPWSVRVTASTGHLNGAPSQSVTRKPAIRLVSTACAWSLNAARERHGCGFPERTRTACHRRTHMGFPRRARSPAPRHANGRPAGVRTGRERRIVGS